MKTFLQCIGFLALVIVSFMMFAAIFGGPVEHTRTLTADQRIEAQQLANRTPVMQRDGTLKPLSREDAEMLVETCAMLRNVKFSDMTPKMLSMLDTCRSHGITTH